MSGEASLRCASGLLSIVLGAGVSSLCSATYVSWRHLITISHHRHPLNGEPALFSNEEHATDLSVVVVFASKYRKKKKKKKKKKKHTKTQKQKNKKNTQKKKRSKNLGDS
eukprot:NODE_28366_length_479_cov_2.673295.p1 GENE.NODE_28366_length_479_cov_2.673295~~NODE_28366_length_479_cov_2.673295.p1  ORF type:complete len:110 (+),score=34.82 NODE_28366_length_479_cov_2.673295:92-421(+)